MSPHISYRNSSLALRTEQAFLIASAAMDVISPLTFLAFAGHSETQRMQEIHLPLSVALGFSAAMAPAGHRLAHSPQPVQEASALGIIPPPALL